MIVVEIDELILRGFPAAERYRIAESVAAEVGRVMSDPAAPRRSETVGAQIARAVYAAVQHA
jgi:hypothetical protein